MTPTPDTAAKPDTVYFDHFEGMWEPPDVDQAHDEWGASCGPAALAAITGSTLGHMRPHLGEFERRPFAYMNARDILAACSSLRRPGKLLTRNDWQAAGRPDALLRIQFGGPWLNPGVPPNVAFRHTHWIAAVEKGRRIYDVNVGFWIGCFDWEKKVVPQITGTIKRADGTFSVRDAVVIEQELAMAKLSVGQKLWAVPIDERYWSHARYVTVASIGRKWAKIDGLHSDTRIDIETLRHDGGNCSPTHTFYESKEQYEAEVYRESLWIFVRQIVGCSYKPPANLSTEAIAGVFNVLKEPETHP